MFSKVILRYLMFEILLMRVLCEDCKNEHLQTQYCMSDLVIRANVQRPLTNTTTHRLRLRTIYKGNRKLLHIHGGNIFYMDEDFDYEFKNQMFSYGDEYIFFGSLKEKHIFTNTCVPMVATKFIKPYMEYALHYDYGRGCDCINYIKKFHVNMYCEYTYSTLIRKGRQCVWLESPQFRKCKKSHS